MFDRREAARQHSNMRLNRSYESPLAAPHGAPGGLPAGVRRRGFLRAAALAAGAGALGYAGARRGAQAELAGARFHGDDLLSQQQAHQSWYRYWLFDWLDEQVRA
jgi:hypothetical protein